ncbi:MAG: hypothetical protein SFU56_00930 [Capsulimonadales bacterium]|nr:hypothetical protein [Capsulimonadales bacterium]
MPETLRQKLLPFIVETVRRSETFAGRTVLLALLLAATWWQVRMAVSGDWFRSGNDMLYILPPLRSATDEALVGWLRGPWIGVELFAYYRPVTSVFWFTEYRVFGEQVASWQQVSVASHLGSTLLLALLLTRMVGSPLAGTIGAFVWATREKIVETLEWTPAQTDHFAAFFGILGLFLWQTFLDARGRRPSRFLLGGASLVSVLLALGSKEIAYPVPLLAALLTLRTVRLPFRTRIALCGVWFALLTGFVGWRILAMQGIGFLPGQATPGRSQASPLTPQKWLVRMSGFLLPQVLRPTALLPFPAVLSVFAGIAAYRRWTSVRTRGVVALIAGVLFFVFMGGPECLLLSDTYTELALGLWTLTVVAFALRREPREMAFALIWGLVAHLPLYHVVYNAAGNVTYLPGIYWGLVWSILVVALLRFVGTRSESEV